MIPLFRRTDVLPGKVPSQLCRLMCGKALPFRKWPLIFVGAAPRFLETWFGGAKPPPHIRRQSREKSVNAPNAFIKTRQESHSTMFEQKNITRAGRLEQASSAIPSHRRRAYPSHL